MAPLGRGAGGRTRARTVDACRRSLARLRTDRIDLYLLHWRGTVPLAETVAAFGRLMRAGQIRHRGRRNFDTSDPADLAAVTAGEHVGTDQILYNLLRRGAEFKQRGALRGPQDGHRPRPRRECPSDLNAVLEWMGFTSVEEQGRDPRNGNHPWRAHRLEEHVD